MAEQDQVNPGAEPVFHPFPQPQYVCLQAEPEDEDDEDEEPVYKLCRNGGGGGGASLHAPTAPPAALAMAHRVPVMLLPSDLAMMAERGMPCMAYAGVPIPAGGGAGFVVLGMVPPHSPSQQHVLWNPSQHHTFMPFHAVPTTSAATASTCNQFDAEALSDPPNRIARSLSNQDTECVIAAGHVDDDVADAASVVTMMDHQSECVVPDVASENASPRRAGRRRKEFTQQEKELMELRDLNRFATTAGLPVETLHAVKQLRRRLHNRRYARISRARAAERGASSNTAEQAVAQDEALARTLKAVDGLLAMRAPPSAAS